MSCGTNIAVMPETGVANLDEKQLKILQWQSQRDISNLISEENLGNELQGKKVSYNQVVGALHERQLGPRVDPIDILPNEIINYILVDVTGCFPYVLIPLTMISKKWRGYILSEPSL
ncbi:hypothetical protein CPB86DRAFT_790366 [Serendipita vermifera]|nr:hypothetical protein CPB86DRAFT_790366 [Serendipita vermifera]